MKLIEHIKQRTPYERTFHAITYEVIGIITSAPIISFITDKPLEDSGILAVIVSVTAMIWNYVYNLIFDKIHQRLKFKKNLFIRSLHSAIFEIGLILFTIPIIAFILNMGFLQAFFLEIGMLLYFFPYTIIFNWIYDRIRVYCIAKYS